MRNVRMCLVVLLGLCAVVAMVPCDVASQIDRPRQTRVWLGVGPVLGAARGLDVGVGATLQLIGERGPHRVALRLVAMGDATTSSNDAISDVALLYGRATSSPLGYAAVAAGPGLVAVDGCVTGPGGDCHTVGLTLAAEAGLQATVVGIGIQLFGNLNTVSSYGGLGLVLLLGWMP